MHVTVVTYAKMQADWLGSLYDITEAKIAGYFKNAISCLEWTFIVTSVPKRQQLLSIVAWRNWSWPGSPRGGQGGTMTSGPMEFRAHGLQEGPWARKRPVEISLKTFFLEITHFWEIKTVRIWAGPGPMFGSRRPWSWSVHAFSHSPILFIRWFIRSKWIKFRTHQLVFVSRFCDVSALSHISLVWT